MPETSASLPKISSMIEKEHYAITCDSCDSYIVASQYVHTTIGFFFFFIKVVYPAADTEKGIIITMILY